MKRYLPVIGILALAATLLLLLWLTVAPSKPKQVQALQPNTLTIADPPESAPAVSPDQTNPPVTEQDSAPINDDIVPAGPRPATSRTSPETVVGPEVGPGLTPGAVLQNMRSVIRNYAADFGGNPFGNNREITAKLNGGNPKQIVFLKEEDGMRINQRGELIDNWGTPFFFHQISATEMEIRSAGPDRKMWTRDDVVIK